jgi:hypothetical protein
MVGKGLGVWAGSLGLEFDGRFPRIFIGRGAIREYQRGVGTGYLCINRNNWASIPFFCRLLQASHDFPYIPLEF